MRRKISLLILVITVILSTTIVFGANFSDINGHWAEKVVIEMSEKGILNGFEDGTFKPNQSITREQFAKILVESLKLEENKNITYFNDVEDGRWSKKYIDIASKYLAPYWVNGNKHFKPTEASVREDVAVAVVKACGLENDVVDANILKQFADENEIAEYNKQYIAIAVKHGIMQGKGENFDPKGSLTRAEVSQLMYNITSKIENGGFKPLVATKYVEYKEEFEWFEIGIPYIVIESDYANKINEEINKMYEMHIKDLEELDGVLDWTYRHEMYINDDILTVVLIMSNYGDRIMSSYNIDVNTGKEIKKDEVLKITNNEYLLDVSLREIYDEIFADIWVAPYLKDEFRNDKNILNRMTYLEFDSEFVKNAYNSCLDIYTSSKNINDINWYIGANKNIIAEISYYFPAGATDTIGPGLFNISDIMNEKGNNYYLIEESNKKIINTNDVDDENLIDSLRKLSNEELNIAYNEIFARHGHDFKNQDLNKHFNNMLWYKPVKGKTVSLEELSEIERNNAVIIKNEIENRKVLLEKFLKDEKIINIEDKKIDGEEHTILEEYSYVCKTEHDKFLEILIGCVDEIKYQDDYITITPVPTEIKEDEFGNKCAYFDLSNMKKGDKLDVTIKRIVSCESYDKKIPEDANTEILDGFDKYLDPQKRIDSDYEKIVLKAEELTKDLESDYEKAKAIFEFVNVNIQMDLNEQYANKGAISAIENMRGTSEETSTLFVAMCRAVNIPSRVVNGYKVQEDDSLGYFAWAEIYLKDFGWAPVYTNYVYMVGSEKMPYFDAFCKMQEPNYIVKSIYNWDNAERTMKGIEEIDYSINLINK